MSFETEKQAELDLNDYIRLNRDKDKIVIAAQQWMDAATVLHQKVDTAKQAEVVAMRNAMIAALQAVLV